MGAAGLDPASLAVATGPALVAGGEAAMATLLEREPPPTGVVAYNDLMAIGALRAVRARGLRIPADVSIVGFDDVEFASYVDPPLTTVAQDQATMGVEAVKALAAQLQADPVAATADTSRPPSPHGHGSVIRLPTVLRIRGTTGPPPRP
jgi:DNA-binding LacI/PurR family transcriptional regulator